MTKLIVIFRKIVVALPKFNLLLIERDYHLSSGFGGFGVSRAACLSHDIYDITRTCRVDQLVGAFIKKQVQVQLVSTGWRCRVLVLNTAEYVCSQIMCSRIGTRQISDKSDDQLRN